MSLLQPADSKSQPFALVLGAAAGPSHHDFFVLGYSQQYDRRESDRHGQRWESTFVLHYREGVRSVIAVLPQRLDDLWRSPQGRIYAVGDPVGVLEVTSAGVTELTISDTPGAFTSIWGTGEEHVFACGHYEPFWLYRRAEVWHRLSLPVAVGGLWRLSGHNEGDVYAVSDRGEILHFDGQHVQRLDSPTTRWLVSIAPMPEERVCVGGYEGVLLYGNTLGWRTIDSGTDAPLLNIVPYLKGTCFITPDGVWYFDGRQQPRCIVRQGGRWISLVGDRLLVVNNEQAWVFDGRALAPLNTLL